MYRIIITINRSVSKNLIVYTKIVMRNLAPVMTATVMTVKITIMTAL